MSKVLISFIGTGQLVDRTRTSSREYKPAKYRFSDEVDIDSTFVADALAQYHHVDKVILIGTVRSMWEGVYEAFSKRQGMEMDMDYYITLGDHCAKANHENELAIPQQSKIEEVLGKESKVVLIRYGLTVKELRENAATILGLDQYLSDGDELIVDITHSFRSLPLYLMNLLVYLRNVSKKNIEISHIAYGMLDTIYELGYAPVVELKDILTINDWISGAYSLAESGDGYKVADLMRQQGRTDVASRIENFSDAMNISHLTGIRNQIGNIAAMKNSEFDPIAAKIIPPVIKQFGQRFQPNAKLSVFQLQVAKWQFEHKNYSSAFLATLESIVTYVCEEEDWDADDLSNRDLAKKILRHELKKRAYTYKIGHLTEHQQYYKSINEVRNGIAHSQNAKNTKSASEMIKILSEALNRLPKLWSDEKKIVKAPTKKNRMFINLSNHPSVLWSEEQRNAGLKYGEIVEMPFPELKPKGDENYIQNKVTEYHKKILDLDKDHLVTVHIMGEMNFVYSLVKLLIMDNITCVASTTERIVIENGNQKTSDFKFVKFRKYQ